MNKFFIVSCLCIWLPYAAICQTSFDTKLQELAEKIATQISQQGKLKVAVWHFVNTQGEITDMGKFIGEDFSVYFTNSSKGRYQVMDRNHLDQILREHKLNSEGFIDPQTAKELGRINAVDAIITGTVDIFETQLKVRIKVLDTESALQISAEIGYLPVDQNIASFLGIPGMGNSSQNSTSTSNRGFNRPLMSNEQVNNPATVNKECETKNTGDYCFENQKTFKVTVDLDGTSSGLPDLTLEPGQTQCIYNKKAQTYDYSLRDMVQYKYFASGEFLIQQCQ